MQESRIRVLIRPRPFSSTERARRDERCLWADPETGTLQLARTAAAADRGYRFDHVFEETSTQNDVFQQALPLLESALCGYNATIFTYGQVGHLARHSTTRRVNVRRLSCKEAALV